MSKSGDVVYLANIIHKEIKVRNRTILIAIFIISIGTNVAQDNEMTVIAGQVSHNGAFLYTFSDPIKHNINLEINQEPVQGVMENNYNGPLGGFSFFHPAEINT